MALEKPQRKSNFDDPVGWDAGMSGQLDVADAGAVLVVQLKLVADAVRTRALNIGSGVLNTVNPRRIGPVRLERQEPVHATRRVC